jgi:translation initiation factor 3 subunit E
MAAAVEHDLTQRISQFLDKHLVVALLEFLSQKQMYDPQDIEAAKLELIEKTNMVDYAVDIYQQLHQTNEVRGGTGNKSAQGTPRPRALAVVPASRGRRRSPACPRRPP